MGEVGVARANASGRGLRRRRRWGSRGAAAVEFALVAPLLLALLFGIVSYGYLLSFRQSLSQAATEGARAAAVAPTAPSTPSLGPEQQGYSAIVAALGPGFSCAEGVLQRDGVTVGSCAITPPGSCSSASCPYTVNLAYDYRAHPLMPRVPFVPMPKTISYSASAEGNG